MRGVIETFDETTGAGTIRSQKGDVYPFTRANLLRRSKEPIVSARVVFRLKNGRVFRAVVPGDQRKWSAADRWEVAYWILEVVLYLPLALMRD
jgi:cold shock CspA family protein